MTDRELLLRRCDAAFAERSVRDVTWPWLRDETGQLFAADAWWREAQVAVVVAPDCDAYTIGRLAPILRTLDAHDITAIPVWPALWEDHERGVDRVADVIGNIHERGPLRHAWGLEGPTHGGA